MRLRFAYLIAWAAVTTVVASASWLGTRSILTAPVDTRHGAGPRPQAVTPSAPERGSAVLPSPDAPPSAGPSWSAVANGKGGTAYRRTFRTTGGETVVWAEPGSARVLSTSPVTGFTVNVRRLAEDAVEVSFTRGRQASRVLVRWWDDAPYAELTESAL